MLKFNGNGKTTLNFSGGNLNTYHVKVQLDLMIKKRTLISNLNTYHVKVQYFRCYC
ncbi:hypothetical protein HMPREF3222_03151 [Clostridium perfringens]|uniref:Uncharacterized protein n=1 Tax=Clostridium perfringens TaxID=1502 RepID=A0A133MLV8_CLOPF|nr:hypothetical protein HMPREF3222_03151 [Clostridium perfringens]